MKNEKSKALQFSVIRDELERLLKAIENLLDRSFPKDLIKIAGFKTFLVLSYKAASTTYGSLRYLSADIPKDVNRRLEFGLTTAPLVRTLADILFNIVFMAEDIPVRTQWYHTGGWREGKEDYNRHVATYGSLPEWQEWLKERGAYLEESRKVFRISEAEANNLKLLRYWPNPGQMVNGKDLQPKNKDFLKYVNDWLYKGLSADSHVSAAALVRRYGALLYEEEGERKEQLLLKLKSDNIFCNNPDISHLY